MSGGSMNYLYRKLLWECDFTEDTHLRMAFRNHLMKVAEALRMIECVDSGDWGPGDEEHAILAVLGSPWKSLTDEDFYSIMPYAHSEYDVIEFKDFARAVEAKLKERNT
jgi:hypothetical protein